jgi:hypothetical protein
MSKNLFENITNDEAATLEWILKNEGATAADYFFIDPTVDGKIHELQKYGFVKVDVTDSLKITELGRSALKEHYQISEKIAQAEKQREEELLSFKAIAEAAQSQAESANKQAELAISESKSAKKGSYIATVISIIATLASIATIVIPLIFG